MSSTKDYLSKYMSKPSSSSTDDYRKKKSKKKKSSSSAKTTVRKGNFAIHDEDEVSWNNPASESEDDYLPAVEEKKAPAYKSNSSNWETVREGEPQEPQQPQRNHVPEWDDVDNEDERPAIAGIVVESETSARLRNPVKKSSKPVEKWRATSPPTKQEGQRQRSFSPEGRKRNRSRSPSPWSSRNQRQRSSRSPSPYASRSRQRSFSPRSPSPKRRNRSPSRSRSRSPSLEPIRPVVGLQTAQEGRRELERKRREEEARMRALDPAKSGRDAETVYRDAQGRKIDRVQEKIEKAAAAKKELEKQEKMMEWGRGLVQREEEQERKKREEEEKLKPLARYKDDEDLNEELKDRERWNDPAARFLTGVKKSKKSAPKYPQYQGSFPPNRFNIRPGYRWDGVDRSTGFEKDYFQRMNAKKHSAMEAHMWSTEDM
ncbi:pre-mRNA-splicing factor CWC26 [Entomortierella parvispora]|uniref:Pre-mRNA-splicing factor CWC26 n=1 Tax=Entomortierella parvispora TaxID=205924 RepID=A0A9P3LSG1_9FUNG|nr:pre-mRNA-splicing factor CWC26 [Entomortierella parvispora]